MLSLTLRMRGQNKKKHQIITYKIYFNLFKMKISKNSTLINGNILINNNYNSLFQLINNNYNSLFQLINVFILKQKLR